MKYANLVFSPTGGTKKVVDAFVSAWGGAARTVDLTDAGTEFQNIAFDPDDAVVIAVPSYGGRVPGLAAGRIAAVRGNGAQAVLICVYGNRAYEDTLVELADLAKQAGFTVAAAVAAVAEHSILRQFAAGRPDQADRDALAGFSQKVMEKLRSGGGAGTVSIPGNRPYKDAGGVGMVPKTGNDCTQCGLCAAKCPAGAIDKNDVRAIDKAKCISCMRCVTICPQHAKSVSKLMLTATSGMLKKACSVRKECELYL